MDRSDASVLADLQMHWDEAYSIGLDGDVWVARFHGSADELRAHTSAELREMIRTDYAYRRQVHRARTGAAGTEATGTEATGTEATGDDDDYAEHFDSTSPGTGPGGSGSGVAGDAGWRSPGSGRTDGRSRTATPGASFAGIRGERMST